MVLKETIISKHIIKPSSPTPDEFKYHKLSYLDQITVPVYISLIFFYKNIDESNPKPHAETSQLLKHSLSQILTVYRPFAGTIQENSYVDCDDTGAPLVEAQVHARLAQIVTEEPQMEELKQLVPVDSISHNDNSILQVKISFFACGGIALGVCMSHKVADFTSLAAFMNAWAATCRGGDTDGIVLPRFDLSRHFPSEGSAVAYFDPREEEIATRRLVFDAEKLERLRQLTASGEVKNPTRVEALSVFIWRQFVEAHRAIFGGAAKTTFAVLHAVNLRTRTKPPIPDHTIGNCKTMCCAFAFDGSDMLKKLRFAIRAVDDSYIKNVVNSEEYLRRLHKMGELLSGTVSLSFTSWWSFPVYGVDFGWGKPVWVSTTAPPYNNTVVLMSTPSEDGIEAWVNMSEDLFQMLHANCNKLPN